MLPSASSVSIVLPSVAVSVSPAHSCSMWQNSVAWQLPHATLQTTFMSFFETRILLHSLATLVTATIFWTCQIVLYLPSLSLLNIASNFQNAAGSMTFNSNNVKHVLYRVPCYCIMLPKHHWSASAHCFLCSFFSQGHKMLQYLLMQEILQPLSKAYT